MEFCRESETELENNENNEIQSTEETELTCCPDERSEKNHVCCLLSISDTTLEEDERAREFIIGTGWEEAVRGWGKTSPTACIWPRKKLKKAKAGEITSSSCLLCFSLAQGSLEAKLLLEAGKLEAGAAEAEGALEKIEKNGGSAPQSQAPAQGSHAAASRELSKLCTPSYLHGEKKSLQIKEFIWHMEDWAIPEALSCKAPRSPAADRRPPVSDPFASKALLVLPPLKSSPAGGLDVLGKKSKSSFWQSEEKLLSPEDACAAVCPCRLKMADGKGERSALEPARPPQAKDAAPFPCPARAEPCCLHWSLLPDKHRACPSTPNTVRYLATLQLLQKQGMQNYRARLKAKEPRAHRDAHRDARKHLLTEAKQEARPRTVEAKLFSRPLLPSLTVSRVVIPISTHRVL